MCYFRTMAKMATSWQEIGARVAEARKVSALSQAELASAVKLDRTAITKIEAGERKIDSLELARIAEVLSRPIEWFITPPLPAVVSRRKARDFEGESQADVLLDGLARDVRLLIELKTLEPPEPPRPKSNIDSVTSAEAAARELRKSLGLSPGPVWDLMAVAERVGLIVFSLDLQKESLDGSYLRLAKGGVALVNGGAPTGRRRFTLVHELGHHVFADDFSPEWIVGPTGDDRERLINAFVIHLLMPRESILSKWQELGGHTEPRWAAIVLGAEYGVSWTAVLGHLCNLGLIDDRTRSRLEVTRPGKADYLEAGIALREELAPPAFSPRFAQAVVRAYKQHKISASRAIALLRNTLDAADLPPENRVPLESMRSQFDLD
jgi:Zn-dependent peptidase ImmA (M78 family)/transcriptional regulator with XRE-family HTH domain